MPVTTIDMRRLAAIGARCDAIATELRDLKVDIDERFDRREALQAERCQLQAEYCEASGYRSLVDWGVE